MLQGPLVVGQGRVILSGAIGLLPAQERLECGQGGVADCVAGDGSDGPVPAQRQQHGPAQRVGEFAHPVGGATHLHIVGTTVGRGQDYGAESHAVTRERCHLAKEHHARSMPSACRQCGDLV